MNKKLIALAVAGALSAPLAVQADDVAISGFADIFYTSTDDKNGTATEDQFQVPEVEVDFISGGFRVDIDNKDLMDGGGADLRIEQANFTTDIANGWSLTGGSFESGMTDDAQDAPDMQFSTNSHLFKEAPPVVSGLAVSGMAGPANVTVGLVNDTTVSGGPDAGTGVLLNVNGSVMEGLHVELGYLSQDAKAGDLIDINALYEHGPFIAGLDYMSADPAAGTDFDSGYSVIGGFDFGNGVVAKARIENLEDMAGTETDVTTLYVAYSVSDNLTVALQQENTEVGAAADTDLTTLELIATF